MNILACPSVFGDPITSFAVDVTRGYVITGSALGAVKVWIQPRLFPKGSACVAADFGDEKREKSKEEGSWMGWIMGEKEKKEKEEFHCIVLSKSSEECVRDFYFQEENIFAVIGDQHIKVWLSYSDPVFQITRFRRQHLYTTCSSTIPLHDNGQVLLVQAGSAELLHMNLNTSEQFENTLPFSLAKAGIAVDLKSNRLVTCEVVESGQELRITNLETRNVQTIAFPRRDKHYWGFQLSSIFSADYFLKCR